MSGVNGSPGSGSGNGSAFNPALAEFSNVSVRLRDWYEGSFLVEVVDSPVGRMRFPDEVEFDYRILPYLEKLDNPEKGQLDVSELIEFGAMLGDMLFPPNVRRIFHKSLAFIRDQNDVHCAGLRLVLEIDDPRLGIIPWEYVHLWEYARMRQENPNEDRDRILAKKRSARDLRAQRSTTNAEQTDAEVKRLEKEIEGIEKSISLRGFLARDPLTSIVRHESFVADPDLAPIELEANSLRVYVTTAEPSDMGDDLDLEDEMGKIKAALQSVSASLTLETQENLTKEALEKRCTSGEPIHVFHFAGHGGFFPVDVVDDEGRLKISAADDEKDDGQNRGAFTTDRGAFAPGRGAFAPGRGAFTPDRGFGEGAQFFHRGPFTTDRGAFAPGRGAFAPGRGAFTMDRGAFAPGRGAFAPGRGAFTMDRGAFAPGRGAFAPGRGSLEIGTGSHRGAIVLVRDSDYKVKARKVEKEIGEPESLLAEIRNLADAVRQVVEKNNGERAAATEPAQTSEPEKTEKPNPCPHHIFWSDEFAKLLKKANVKVVLLSACETARRDSGAFQWTGVAPALLKAGIPVVIGMQYLISDNTAIAFSKAFYEALALGLNIDQAVALGRQCIMDLPEDDRDQDWGVPVLYTRSTQESLNAQIKPMAGRRAKGLVSPENRRDDLLDKLYREYVSAPSYGPSDMPETPSVGA